MEVYVSKILKIGIAGAGFIATAHYDCAKTAYGVDCEISGVTDIVNEKAVSFATERGIKHYPTFTQMLREVDVVDICTPPFVHAENILEAAAAGKQIICEKPLIGYAPDKKDWDNFNGINASKEKMLNVVTKKAEALHEAVTKNNVTFIYFENFVYTPQIQKEAEIVAKTKAQILRMMGEEAHKGNLAAYSSQWKYAGGGSLISTGSHPLGAILYLKRVEGIARNGKPIRPASVSARIHTLTKCKGYDDLHFLRSDYHDVEDYGWAHVVFEDGTVGDIIAGATVLGGINDYVDVFAANHRTRININPVTLMETYNPKASQFDDIYINCSISTNEGWLKVAMDENWLFGYKAEMQDALECFSGSREPISGLELAIDTILTIYSGYLSSERDGQEVKIQKIGR
jgi:predicted dehydrogenase